MKSPFVLHKGKSTVDGPDQLRAEHLANVLPDRHAFPSKRGKNVPGMQPGAQVEMIQERDHGHGGVNRNKSRQRTKS